MTEQEINKCSECCAIPDIYTYFCNNESYTKIECCSCYAKTSNGLTQYKDAVINDWNNRNKKEESKELNPCKFCGKYPHKIYQPGYYGDSSNDIVTITCIDHKDNYEQSFRRNEIMVAARWNEANMKVALNCQEMEPVGNTIKIKLAHGQNHSMDITLHLSEFTREELTGMSISINNELINRFKNMSISNER